MSSSKVWAGITGLSTLFWVVVVCVALLLLRVQEQEPSLPLYISDMTPAGVSEMCEVWVQDPAAVVEAFAALGFDSWEVPGPVHETCVGEEDA